MNYKEIITKIGNESIDLVNSILNKISLEFGLEPTRFQTWIINLIALFIVLYIASKFTKDTTKVILIILIIILIASTFLSIFV